MSKKWCFPFFWVCFWTNQKPGTPQKRVHTNPYKSQRNRAPFRREAFCSGCGEQCRSLSGIKKSIVRFGGGSSYGLRRPEMCHWQPWGGILRECHGGWILWIFLNSPPRKGRQRLWISNDDSMSEESQVFGEAKPEVALTVWTNVAGWDCTGWVAGWMGTSEWRPGHFGSQAAASQNKDGDGTVDARHPANQLF